ncbi:MAG: NADH-quinone oxidoreductase subunit D, partial [Mucilaginibacter sp.]|uniref:NADH-quinone oxidoreductase subunit D n=1 Tax=Mucilaginibacter sp. TaxID=1882438 RepID=UPI0031B51A2C
MQNHPVYTDNDPQSELSTLNLGPTHPATHGVFQNVLQIDGERIVSGVSTIGYIHRAFEKIAEHRPFYQITPLTDRLNYCSSPINNMGWHMTVEKLLGITTPKRVDYLRVIIMELARISDHIVCNAILGVDTGALTGFTYMMQWREHIYEIYEEVCGSRLTTNIGRIGGFERNFNTIAFTKLKKFVANYPKVLKEFEALFNRNRIFVDRTKDVAAVTAEDALNYSWTGPILRAAGVDYDVRAMNPYSSYEDFDFEVPVGTNGDVYSRFLVRNEEMWQSLRIIEQALVKLEKEPTDIFHADVPEFYLPPKEEVYNNM